MNAKNTWVVSATAAAGAGHALALDCLARLGVDILKNGFDLLCEATHANRINVIRFLLSLGVNPRSGIAVADEALYIALRRNHDDAARVILTGYATDDLGELLKEGSGFSDDSVLIRAEIGRRVSLA